MEAPLDDLVFGLTLGVDDAPTRAALEELCTLIGEDAHCRVQPTCVASPEALAEGLASGAVHVGWISPTLLLIAPELATIVPLLASVRQGVAAFHSVVFSAESSPIRTLGDLPGRRAAWVHATSASGYLVPRLTLVRQGVDVTTVFAHEAFYETHGGVVEAVFDGVADVGATYAHFEAGDASRPLFRTGCEDARPGSRPRILAVSGPIPSDMIVAHPGVPLATRVAFAGALCRLPSDPVGHGALRRVVGADDFAPVSIAALEELEALKSASRDLLHQAPAR
ncbi:phosphate/phosphite/phosphonate ABC transporter substrate-binding protein [Haliangium sp.]|uniref:phosphate/phosphite/phosphonate ABC transporter substrate-binding protein n=1 Tax=Haliangium sp. TaxID=2663208 RepID=UPI003D1048AB